MPYRSQHVCKLFNISQETVRVWATEFAPYLSPAATPGKNKHRFFSAQDMEVFSLVAEMKARGMAFAEIHATLQSGQRGRPPTLPPEDVQAIISSDHETRLAFEVDKLQLALLQAHEELRRNEEQLKELERIKEENIRLKAQAETAAESRQQLEALIDRLTKRIEEISLTAGREYGKGIMDALRERGDLPKKE